jgi:hypothetical protein
MAYAQVIIELMGCKPEEAPLVEALMRDTFGTLDAIDRTTFKKEAKIRLALARSNPGLATEAAKYHGLIRP